MPAVEAVSPAVRRNAIEASWYCVAQVGRFWLSCRDLHSAAAYDSDEDEGLFPARVAPFAGPPPSVRSSVRWGWRFLVFRSGCNDSLPRRDG